MRGFNAELDGIETLKDVEVLERALGMILF